MEHIKRIDEYYDVNAVISSAITQNDLAQIPTEVIVKQTKDLSVFNTHKVFGNPLSGNIGNDKCLLEGVTSSLKPISVKKHISKKYEPSIKYKALPKQIRQVLDGNAKWVLNISASAINAYNAIVPFYDLEDWQIQTPQNPDGTYTYVLAIIPNINDNILFMDESMKCFGYYRSCNVDVKALFPKIGNMDEWVVLQYEQRVQEFINDKIRQQTYLYHVSPTSKEHKILKNGLVPKSKNEQFGYPDRVYLLNEEIININEGLQSVADMLYAGKTKSRTPYVNYKEYTFYRIDISKIPNNVNFSIDYNFAPLSVFSADNIPPYAIEIIGHYIIQ